jgi:YidC/Oxa1 family membrane protein insertase
MKQMENKNTIVALFLMMLLWVGYTFLFPAPPIAPVQSGSTAAVLSTTAAAPEISNPSLTVTASTPAEAPVAQLKEIVVETDLYRAVLTTKGARLKEFYLKNYHSKADETSPEVNLITSGAQGGTLALTGEGDFTVADQAIYAIDQSDTVMQIATGEEKSLSFSYLLPTGIILQKIYTFNGQNYSVAVDLQVQNPTASARQGIVALALIEDTEKTFTGDIVDDTSAAVSLAGTKLRVDTLSDLGKEDKTYKEEVLWSGYKNKYFIKALGAADQNKMDVAIQKKGTIVETRFKSPLLLIPSGQIVSFKYFSYLGPLDYQILQDAGHNLVSAVDMGFFEILAKPLFYVLKFFYGYVGNYGWAIILLTVLIKIIFWPLTDKSYKSMKAMQTLQPEMQKLREKHKNDRDTLNKEIMTLYKEHRVNPLGGCLPMVVQIPVFFALYQVLMNMIELRHAPFIFWLTDLSVKDPYYITPLVMGATMFIQQKLTPSQLDPIQQKIFLIMPVVFTFLFLNFPSGLVVYWLVNNILTIAQQLSVNRKKI